MSLWPMRVLQCSYSAVERGMLKKSFEKIVALNFLSLLWKRRELLSDLFLASSLCTLYRDEAYVYLEERSTERELFARRNNMTTATKEAD